jgi:hypothetical protein
VFHVGEGTIEAGQALRPYALPEALADAVGLVGRMLDWEARARAALLTDDGRLRRQYTADPMMQLVFIEAIFERARARVAPTLPSRFASVFLWPTVALAQAFRDRYRPRGVIHRCVLVDGEALPRDASLVAVGMDLSAVLDDELRAIEERAVRYWSADGPFAYAELLVQGTVTVTEALSPGR